MISLISIGFLIVCCLLLFFKNNKHLIKKKLRLGAMIITLNAIICISCPPPYATCYEPLPTDGFDIQNADYNQIEYSAELEIVYSDSMVIHGTINYPSTKEYSYRIEDLDGITIQKDNILALDGVMDSDESEEFEIVLDPSITVGDFYLYLFLVTQENQPDEKNQYGYYDNMASGGYILLKIIDAE